LKLVNRERAVRAFLLSLHPRTQNKAPRWDVTPTDKSFFCEHRLLRSRTPRRSSPQVGPSVRVRPLRPHRAPSPRLHLPRRAWAIRRSSAGFLFRQVVGRRYRLHRDDWVPEHVRLAPTLPSSSSSGFEATRWANRYQRVGNRACRQQTPLEPALDTLCEYLPRGQPGILCRPTRRQHPDKERQLPLSDPRSPHRQSREAAQWHRLPGAPKSWSQDRRERDRPPHVLERQPNRNRRQPRVWPHRWSPPPVWRRHLPPLRDADGCSHHPRR